MATFDERAKDWDTPERVARAAEAAAVRSGRTSTSRRTDRSRRHRRRDRVARAGAASMTSASSSWPSRPTGCCAVIAEKLAAADLPTSRPSSSTSWPIHRRTTPFDLAVSLLVLHHVEDTAAALAAIRRPARPGGRIAMSDLDTEDGTFHSAEAEGIHHLGFDRTALGELARNAGFVDVEIPHRDRDRRRGSALPGLPAARPEPVTS